LTRDEYALEYSGGYNRTGQRVIVPDDVVRVSEHEPCFRCGTARGPCKHRIAA
jgi:hypothetical protein